MKRPAQIFNRFISEIDGTISIFAICLVLICGLLGGLAVDYSNGIHARAHLKAVVDASALAAAQDLPDEDAALATALAYASLNAPPATFGTVVEASDVLFGTWDRDTRTFTAGTSPANAVHVTGSRLAADGNEVETFFLGYVGDDSWDVNAEAVAIGLMGPCAAGGIFSGARTILQSNNDILEDFCVYGDDGVEIGSDTYVQDGGVIQMPNLSDFAQGGSNSGVTDALKEESMPLELLPQVNPVVTSLLAGESTYLPSWVTYGPVYISKIDSSTTLVPNTFYVVSGTADLPASTNLSNIVVASAEKITVGSDTNLSNVVLVADGEVALGSNLNIGSVGYCAAGRYSVTIIATGKVQFGSNNNYRGMLLATLDILDMGSNLLSIEGVYMQSAGEVNIGSANSWSSCANILVSDLNIGTSTGSYSFWGLVQ